MISGQWIFLSAKLILVKIMNGFWWNSVERLSMAQLLNFGGDPDSFMDCGSLSRILCYQEIATVWSSFYLPGDSAIVDESSDRFSLLLHLLSSSTMPAPFLYNQRSMAVDHGGDWGTRPPRIWEGNANANCPTPTPRFCHTAKFSAPKNGVTNFFPSLRLRNCAKN